MSPLAQFDLELGNVIREIRLRLMVPRVSEFDYVWEAANRVCDRYEIGKVAQP